MRYQLHLVLCALMTACATATSDRPDFEVVAVLDVGLNPHQIVFSPDGHTAWVAAAGSDRLTVIRANDLTLKDALSVPDTPLGVAVLQDGGLAATRFGADEIVRFPSGGTEPVQRVTTGGAPSLLVGPIPSGHLLVSVEQSDLLWLLDTRDFTLTRSYDVGRRPFPPAATSDGRLAFVPGYDDGTVTIIDLWNERIVATTSVGAHPSGGVVWPDDIVYATAVRGEDKIVLINTASFDVVDSIVEGIGDEPFSVALAPNGRLAFVNNTASHDISVIDVATRSVITRIPVGEQPIVMNVHPSGKTLWVSSEGSDELTIFAIPLVWQQTPAPPTGPPAEVAVMGMIHDRHPTSETWGLAQVESTIRGFAPDLVCAEIPPNRWDRIWRNFRERDVVDDPRVIRFPEYNDFMLRLAVELDFTIVPCAAWTAEMADLRTRRIQEFETRPDLADLNAEYQERRRAARAAAARPLKPDDPHYIHSTAYDDAARAEYSVYDEYQNDWIGPGGWTNINVAHMALIDRTIQQNPGKRILVTFGAGHKYWFLEQLHDRDDVRLIDLTEFLPSR